MLFQDFPANGSVTAQIHLLKNLPQIITAVGALGTAAAGLVDATKVFGGGINHVGFRKIRQRMAQFLPTHGDLCPLKFADVVDTVRANWFNGRDLVTQKAIAKSLIKLNFNTATAKKMASASGFAEADLTTIASAMVTGAPLTTQQSDVYGRFDMVLTALLDETYQHADQAYGNAARALAVVFALLLALVGASILSNALPWQLRWVDFSEAIVVGLLATPLAPIAKDLSTALSTAVNAMQQVKK